MFYKIIFLLLFLVTSQFTWGQKTARPLYSLEIIKVVNNGDRPIYKSVTVDSLGDIYMERKKVDTLNLEQLTHDINRFIVEEKAGKTPGNNNISFIEVPAPEVNQQRIIIWVKFLDDIQKERDLRNKTYYRWGKVYDIGFTNYPLFNYLTNKEYEKLKNLLN